MCSLRRPDTLRARGREAWLVYKKGRENNKTQVGHMREMNKGGKRRSYQNKTGNELYKQTGCLIWCYGSFLEADCASVWMGKAQRRQEINPRGAKTEMIFIKSAAAVKAWEENVNERNMPSLRMGSRGGSHQLMWFGWESGRSCCGLSGQLCSVPSRTPALPNRLQVSTYCMKSKFSVAH